MLLRSCGRKTCTRDIIVNECCKIPQLFSPVIFASEIPKRKRKEKEKDQGWLVCHFSPSHLWITAVLCLTIKGIHYCSLDFRGNQASNKLSHFSACLAESLT